MWGGLYLALNPFRALNNGDLYWQQWLGDYILRFHHLPAALGAEAFTAPGAAWVPQEWFVSIFVALAMRHHLLVFFAVTMAIIPIAILISVYARSRERATPEAIALVLAFTGTALVASFGIRAQVLGWGCFAAFLLCLERRDRWAYAAVLIVVLWANVHASVMLAPAFLAARLVGAASTDGLRGLLRNRDLLIFGLTIPAILCTPLGWRLPIYAAMLATSPIRHYIEEWQPVSSANVEFLLGGLPIALAIALGGWRMAVRNSAESLPLAVLFVAMLLARRNVPLFAIAAAPVAAQGLDVLFPALYKLRAKISEMERFAIVSSGIAIASAAVFLFWHQRYEPPQTPFAAMTRLSADRAPHRLFCENFNACSAALQYPQLGVFIDGRADPYPLSVWRSYVSIIRLNPSWDRTLQQYGVDAVLASRGSSFANALAVDTSWHSAFHDAGFIVYVRN